MWGKQMCGKQMCGKQMCGNVGEADVREATRLSTHPLPGFAVHRGRGRRAVGRDGEVVAEHSELLRRELIDAVVRDRFPGVALDRFEPCAVDQRHLLLRERRVGTQLLERELVAACTAVGIRVDCAIVGTASHPPRAVRRQHAGLVALVQQRADRLHRSVLILATVRLATRGRPRLRLLPAFPPLQPRLQAAVYSVPALLPAWLPLLPRQRRPGPYLPGGSRPNSTLLLSPG